ncbi:hypothetical protein V5799_034263 [Amblyomma americanum]|uniref:Uncharacterized protein n=1 Tax=Amblyomma americanum TaxID=6943 RepID=A0AAQ4DKZ6_AMBAM
MAKEISLHYLSKVRRLQSSHIATNINVHHFSFVSVLAQKQLSVAPRSISGQHFWNFAPVWPWTRPDWLSALLQAQHHAGIQSVGGGQHREGAHSFHRGHPVAGAALLWC